MDSESNEEPKRLLGEIWQEKRKIRHETADK
jgi:hypothetical protein